jgi:hypothetical protein
MKSFLIRSVGLVALVVFVWSAAMAQTEQKKSAASGAPPAADDLTGVWVLKGGGGGAAANDHISSWVDKDNPTLTPLGAQLMASHKPSRGPRTVVPALENDPQAGGNPPGLVRTLGYGEYGMKFIKLPDSMFQVFEWYNHWRQIWTDGRKSPDWDSIGPYWYGYSVGNFKGDEFEVQTESLDNRAWLDDWGTPFSEAMKLVEHWRRVDHDTLALKFTINDPMVYTQSWTTKEIRYKYQSKGSQRGELVEAAFAPIDEQEFIENLRDGGAGKNKK